MWLALWPDPALDHVETDMTAWLDRGDTVTIVAASGAARLCGFAVAGERPYVDGCSTSPVAYLEGWYVDPDMRLQSVGSALVRAIESWARARGHRELGSDTELHNLASQRAHERLGFSETERLVLYRKTL